jgi:hypothetical protein
MNDPVAPFDALLDLDARHDELLRQLEELDHRVEKVLAEYLPAHDAARHPVAGFDGASALAKLAGAALEPPAAAA